MKVLFCLWLALLTVIILPAQKVLVKPQFAEGETYIITVELKNTTSQQAAGQPIDFSVSGTAIHSYHVIDIDSSNNSTILHHQPEHFTYSFDGMGQQRKFDSGKEEDMTSQPGSYFKELLDKTFDLTIDSTGNTLMAVPEMISLSGQKGGMIIVMNMIKDLTDIIYPPGKREKNFFAVLPAYEVGVGDTWTDSVNTENEKSVTENTLSAITDSTIVVIFKTKSSSTTKMQMMGGDATSNMNSSATGQIIVDKETGIIREKTTTTDANGTTETTVGTVPTTGKMTIVIKVRKE